ncbi:MAG: ABC transporter ATP-binding protein [Myxococcota bacterium]
MASIHLKGVSKRHGALHILDSLDLYIPDRAFVVLVGPSGCGKSTLLRLMAGLESLSGGEIWLGDRPIHDVPPRLRDIAMVFQSYALYPHMTVQENMSLALRLRQVPPTEIQEKVQAVAELLGLSALLQRKPAALSGGQRQRVAMGRAIVRHPQVFLFDEPLSNLDAELRLRMRTEIKQLHQRLQTTMVYVTHDQTEAMTLADRIVVLKGGRIQQEGPPIEVFQAPRNRFVAGFIGSPPMNFIPARVESDGVLAWLRVPSLGLRISYPQQHFRLPPSQELELGVRPEQLRMGGHASDLQLEGSVVVVEPLGTEMYVTIACSASSSEPESRLLFRTVYQAELLPGARVRLSCTLDELHLFCARSGESLRKGC